MAASEDITHLSIGEVLALLRQEFPDLSISKIRFLEGEGLIDPERTPSGYRKFYDLDIVRLRWILRQQRDHFLPLKVIKAKLEHGGEIDFEEIGGVQETLWTSEQDERPATSLGEEVRSAPRCPLGCEFRPTPARWQDRRPNATVHQRSTAPPDPPPVGTGQKVELTALEPTAAARDGAAPWRLPRGLRNCRSAQRCAAPRVRRAPPASIGPTTLWVWEPASASKIWLPPRECPSTRSSRW